MSYLIEPDYPDAPIRYFQDLTQIPRPSGKEEKVSQWVFDFAKEHDLDAERDELLNVIVRKKGQGTGISSAPVILQGHMDMVCEKNESTEFDFETQPLNLYMDGNLLKAKGTTLGGDDGVAVAYMMAILADQQADHPPLECVFTTQEETGLGGAEALAVSKLKGRKLINIDCGPDDTFVVSSAGGARMKIALTGKQENQSFKEELTIRVEGLQGGHSGTAIQDGLGNALKIMGRLMEALCSVEEGYLIEINGGDKDNAIPRECKVKLGVQNADFSIETLTELAKQIELEYKETDADLKILFFKEKSDSVAFSKEFTKELADLLFLLPNGPAERFVNQGDRVASSSNVAAIRMNGSEIDITVSVRAAADSMMENLIRQVEILGEKYGANVEVYNRYPGWSYNPDSPLRKTAEEVYRSLFQEDAKVEVVHGGLECGIFKGKEPTLDILAIGPDTIAIHTPEEALDIPSFEKEYQFLKALLKNLC